MSLYIFFLQSLQDNLQQSQRLTSPLYSCHQWRWTCSAAIILILLSVQDNLQQRQKAWRVGPVKAVGLWFHHSVLAISEDDSAVMPWFCSCQLWQWVCKNVVIFFLQSLQSNCCSSVKRLTSPFCSCHQWTWICSTGIILFLLSVQDNLQKRQKAWRFCPLKAVGLWCHHSALAISEGDSAVMP